MLLERIYLGGLTFVWWERENMLNRVSGERVNFLGRECAVIDADVIDTAPPVRTL